MQKTKTMPLFLIIFFIFIFARSANAWMLRVPPAELVERSDAIVHGFVVEKETLWSGNLENMETVVSIYTKNAIKGEVGELLEIRVPGGEIDGQFMFITDQPDFQVGQEVVVFLDSTLSRLIGQIQGKATIKNGLVLEMMMDSNLYLQSIESLVNNMEPPVSLDGTFAGVSTIEAYIKSLIVPAFGYDGLHWDQNQVKVSINENCDDVTDERKAIRAAMQTWNNVKADFLFVYSGENNRTETTQNDQNEAFFSNSDDNPDAIAWCAIMGYGNYISEVDLTFLLKYSWSTKDNPYHNEMDLQSIATHEFGHFLCLLDLYDSSDYDKTMYGYGSTGDTDSRTLHDDDKDGIIHIYGPGPGVDDVPETPPNLDDGLTSANCEQIVDTLYDDCGYTLRDSTGGSFSKGMAYDKCDYGSTSISWLCILGCYEESDGCTAFFNCAYNQCDDPFKGSGDDDQDDDNGGGICG